MPRTPPDLTPVAVALPRYAWRYVKDALIYDREHALKRARERVRPLPKDGVDLNMVRAAALTDAIAAINGLKDKDGSD